MDNRSGPRPAAPQRRNFTPRRARHWPRILVPAVCLLLPWAVLLVLSLGVGWQYPSMFPETLNLLPWRMLLTQRQLLLSSLMTSLLLSLTVAVLATLAGLLISRILRQVRSAIPAFLVFLPWVMSPVVAAVCLYDLFIRLGLAGTLTGVLLAQTLFATSFAAIFFMDLWTHRTDREESLIRTLGGGTWQVWQHVVLPNCRPLLPVCLVQTGLFSWLDYGLVSMIGGGHVSTLTLRLFALIREASIHQAALASLLLTLPSLLAVAFLFLRDRLTAFPLVESPTDATFVKELP
ncbi:MAG: hypothetical protein RLZZ232_2996 [Planctomycetota bacterium]